MTYLECAEKALEIARRAACRITVFYNPVEQQVIVCRPKQYTKDILTSAWVGVYDAACPVRWLAEDIAETAHTLGA